MNSTDSDDHGEYVHLNSLRPEARAAIDGSVDAKLCLIFADKFVVHEDAKRVLALLKELPQRPQSERPACYALVAPSNFGKTSVINRLYRDLGGDPAHKVGVHENIPILIVPLPSRPTDPRIALALGRDLRMPIFGGKPSREVSDIIIREVKKRLTRLLIVTELDNLNPLPKSERMVAFDFLRDFTNYGISLVTVGLEESYQKLLEDEELGTRLRPLRLTGFGEDQNFADFLATLETFYPLRRPSGLPQYMKAILRRTRGIVGNVVMLLNEAAAWAVRNSREVIDAAALADCNYTPPGTEGRAK